MVPAACLIYPFLLSISVHKQWRTSAKQRQLQEEVRQPHLCENLWSEHCLGQCVAAEGTGLSAVWAWLGCCSTPPTTSLQVWFQAEERVSTPERATFLLPSLHWNGSWDQPCPCLSCPLLPIAFLLIQDSSQAYRAKSSTGAGDSCREKNGKGEMSPAKSELSWNDLSGAGWSSQEHQGWSWKQLHRVESSIQSGDTVWQGLSWFQGFVCHCFPLSGAQGQRDCCGECLPPCLFLGTAMWCWA